jgi:hypothetical protein
MPIRDSSSRARHAANGSTGEERSITVAEVTREKARKKRREGVTGSLTS